MKTPTPYLFFDGNCEQAMRFYEACFGGELKIMRMSEGSFLVPAEVKNRVMHAQLSAGEMELMASDQRPEDTVSYGDNIHLSVVCDSAAQQDQLFEKLSAGGKVDMAPEDVFWGARFGSCTDRFGVHWMLSVPKA